MWKRERLTASAREPGGSAAVIFRDPDGVVDVEPRPHPCEHPRRIILVKGLPMHEQPDYSAPGTLLELRDHADREVVLARQRADDGRCHGLAVSEPEACPWIVQAV
jgi:hypothetical protein